MELDPSDMDLHSNAWFFSPASSKLHKGKANTNMPTRRITLPRDGIWQLPAAHSTYWTCTHRATGRNTQTAAKEMLEQEISLLTSEEKKEKKKKL